MKKQIIAVLLAFALLLSFVPALPAAAAEDSQTTSGTTYYVSSLHGAEGNNGTSESTPFASLLKINEITLQPGDRVLLERGSVFVDEYLHVKGSGSEDAPIIIDVYGDESQPKPLIQTNGNGVWYQDYGKRLDNLVHKYRGNVSSCILLYDVEYIEISNIAMTNEGNFASGEVYNSLTRIDRTGVAGIAENIGTVDHVYLRNLDIRNVQGHVRNKHMANGGIYLLCHNPDNAASTGVSKFDDVLIEGCRLDEVNRWGIAVGYTAYWDQFTYGPTIDPNVCQTYGSTNVVIRNNYLTNIGGDGITTMYCYQPLMEFNVLDGYCQDMTDEIYGPSDGGLVAAGIWPWMCKTAILQYNEVYNSTYNPDGQAWDADWGDNAIYQYNYSCNNAGGAVMFCGQYACNTVFRYNISQNDLSGVLNLASSPNGEIYNNVFYIKEGVKVNRTGMSGGRGNTISNNIFYYSGSTPADATLGNWGDISAQWSNNVYYNYANIPADDHAITADPMFVDPGKGPSGAQASGLVHDRSVFDGYKLQDGSPAIDAGVPIADNGGLDFFGNELDLIPDIGVYDAGTCQAEADNAVRVIIPLGDTVTLSDSTGDYTGADLTGLDTKIASLALRRMESVSTPVVSAAVSTLEAGESYIICNTNTGSAITTTYESAPAWSTNALRLGGSNTVADNNVWILEPSGSGYKIKSAAGTYINIDLNASALDSVGDVFTPAYSNGTWTLRSADGYYLDNLGRLDYLGGWTEVGNSSTWNIYKVTTQSADGGTELTFTGNYPGTTSVVVGQTLYKIEVTGQVVEVSLNPGETATFTDSTGNYVDADTSALDPLVATVTLTGVSTEDSRSLSQAVTALESGKDYLILNTRAGKPLTNVAATAAADAGAGSGLSLAGVKEDVAINAVWTVEGSNGSYTVKDANGKYLTIGSNTAGVSASSATLSIARNGSTWTINQGGAYLNDFGGAGTCAAGWQDSTAAGDVGSQWNIYQVIYTSSENGTQIVFTGVGVGETSLRLGNTIYEITVTDPEHTCVFDKEVATEEYLATEATCTDPAEYYYSCECGEKGTEIFQHGDALGHNYVDGVCDRCGEDDPNYVAPKADKVIRLAGSSRWDTALKVADEMKANLGAEKFDAIIIASGNGFADALAGSYLSTVKNAPILLSWGQGGGYEFLDNDNIEYIKENLAEDGVVYLLGGVSAVPELYETELADYEVKRLGGKDRFETNLLILEEAGVEDGSEILVCTATNFADSLSASATGMPILLVWNELGELFGDQPEFLAGLKDCTFTVIGGESAVSAKLAEAIGAYGEVTRLAGGNRFETSVLVAQKYFEAPETAVLAYAWNYPDGLCGGSLAFSMGAPLILTMTKYEAQAVEYAESVDITTGIVLGGDTLISDDAVRAIFAMDAEAEIIVK